MREWEMLRMTESETLSWENWFGKVSSHQLRFKRQNRFAGVGRIMSLILCILVIIVLEECHMWI